MKIRLSKRLEMIASFIPAGCVLADIGTDHAWVPVRLVLDGTVEKAIAADVRKGPILIAEKHIREAGLADRIETRISDGFQNLLPGEADCVLIAGMGGETITAILKGGEQPRKDGAVFNSTVSLFVLSPNTEWHLVRRYLRENRYRILDEKMTAEGGKFYLVMKAVPSDSVKGKSSGDPYGKALRSGFSPETSDLFGPCLLLSADPVLAGYLRKEKKQYEEILDALENENRANKNAARKSVEREQEIRSYLFKISEALA
jgi:tRNA (adenine22-N1)-methyltransferase